MVEAALLSNLFPELEIQLERDLCAAKPSLLHTTLAGQVSLDYYSEPFVQTYQLSSGVIREVCARPKQATMTLQFEPQPRVEAEEIGRLAVLAIGLLLLNVYHQPSEQHPIFLRTKDESHRIRLHFMLQCFMPASAIALRSGYTKFFNEHSGRSVSISEKEAALIATMKSHVMPSTSPCIFNPGG